MTWATTQGTMVGGVPSECRELVGVGCQSRGRKVLIFYAHQEPKSLNGSLKNCAVEELRKQDCNVIMSDLYAMQFEPRATRNDIIGCLHKSEHVDDGVESWEAYKRRCLASDLIEEQRKVQEAKLVIFQIQDYCIFVNPKLLEATDMSLEDIHMNTQDLLQKEELDAGGFGMVSLCYHKKYGLVVLKTVYTGPQRTEYNASLLEEGKIMRKLSHDRVVKLLGIILEDGNYSLVMEYVHKGNLMKVLKTSTIPLSVKGRFILEIVEGMLYLNEQSLVHKDLKPENILVDDDFHIKIADLGVACFKNWSRLTKEETSRQRKIKSNSKSASRSAAGTLFYMAPEHLLSVNTKPVEKSDVYSFGIVLWAIFANKEPYE
ncbi:hypothetical protein KIL84_011013, partial [Mauremys mutica]